MSDTPLLGLPYLSAAQAQKHVTHNEALTIMDGLVMAGVKSRTLSVPPASPAPGDRYLVAASPTGVWSGQEGKVAAHMDGAWRFFTALEGWRLWVDDEDVLVVWTGSAWQSVGGNPTELQNLTLLGVNATADAANKLTVSSTATLFNHTGAGHQIKVNKAAAGDTASLLFQTGYSGRAEMGTAGDDDFRIKSSADGATFHDALTVQAASGMVTANQSLRLAPRAADPVTPLDGELWYSSASSSFRKRQNGVTSDLATTGVAGSSSDAFLGSSAADFVPPSLRGRKALFVDVAGIGFTRLNDGAAADVGALTAYPSVTLTNATGGLRFTRKRLLETVSADALRLAHDVQGRMQGALFEAAYSYLHTYSQPTVAQCPSATQVTDAAAPDGWSGAWIAFGDNSVQRYAYLSSQATVAGDLLCSSVLVRMDDGAAPVPGLNSVTGDFAFNTAATALKPSDGASGFDVTGPFANNVYQISWYVVSTGAGIRPPSPIKYVGQSARSFVVGHRMFGPGRYPPSLFPATGAAPSRAADRLSLPVSGFTADEITMAGEFTCPPPDSVTRTLALLKTGSDKIEINFAAGSVAPVMKLTVGGTDQFSGTGAALTPGTAYRFYVAASKADKTIRWKFTGVGAGSSAALVTPSLSFTPADLDVGNAAGISQLGSAIKALAVIDRAWTAAEGESFTDPGGTPVLSSASAALSADVQLTANNTFYDGPSLTLAAGTWLITAHAQFIKTTTTASQVTARISDGTTHYASQNAYHASVANITLGFGMSCLVTLAAPTTIKVQMATTVGNAACLMKAAAPNNASGNNATMINAVRIQ